jgi:outer membrane receptor protein involved in Fe transport
MKQARTATIDKRNGISITEPGDSTGGRSSPHAGYDDHKLERCLAMKSNPLVLHSGVMLLCWKLSFPMASAAAADESSTESSGTLDEVVVTARKQSERLQDVPLSVTALTAETLENSGALTIQDIGREVPGLNVVSVAPGQNQLIIRGVSSAGGVPTVGYYIDDTPIESIGNVAGLAYNEAKLSSTIAGAQGSAGDTLENAPRWMGSTSAEYDRQITAGISGFGRVDFNTTTRQFNNFNPTSNYYERAGYSLVNARVGATWQKWQASLFINNAFDKHAETALPSSYAIDLPTTRRLSLNQPRTIGLDFGWNY